MGLHLSLRAARGRIAIAIRVRGPRREFELQWKISSAQTLRNAVPARGERELLPLRLCPTKSAIPESGSQNRPAASGCKAPLAYAIAGVRSVAG